MKFIERIEWEKKPTHDTVPLNGLSGQIRLAREWYMHWIGLSQDMPRHRFLTFLNLILNF